MKYELIKKYPGSPDLGFIASPKSPGDYYVNSNWIYPEKYPEFWEKVVELDYEILKSCPIEGSIYSVKRISDGVVFTLGDKVMDILTNELTGFKSQVIKYFNRGEKMICQAKSGTTMPLSTIIKVKDPLFTTYDEVEIFEGDSYYSVYNSDYKYEKLHWSILKPANNTCLDLKAVGILRFSTLENAEKYIQDNKPKRLYTEDEMVRALENWGMCRVDISYVNEFLNK